MPNPNLDKLGYENFLLLIGNSEGVSLFNNLVVRDKKTGKEIDVLENGTNSGAYYVGGILTIMGMIDRPHATVFTTLKTLAEDKRWLKVGTDALEAGDVIAWEVNSGMGSPEDQIGFYVDKTCAYSTSYRQRKVIRHSPTFQPRGIKGYRRITRAYRFSDWDNLYKDEIKKGAF